MKEIMKEPHVSRKMSPNVAFSAASFRETTCSASTLHFAPGMAASSKVGIKYQESDDLSIPVVKWGDNLIELSQQPWKVISTLSGHTA